MKTFIATALILWTTYNVAFANGDLSDSDLKKANKIYVAKCAKCHQFYEPKDYSDEDWNKWMFSMARKSKLKPEQFELLSRYLDAYRKGKIKLSK